MMSTQTDQRLQPERVLIVLTQTKRVMRNAGWRETIFLEAFRATGVAIQLHLPHLPPACGHVKQVSPTIPPALIVRTVRLLFGGGPHRLGCRNLVRHVTFSSLASTPGRPPTVDTRQRVAAPTSILTRITPPSAMPSGVEKECNHAALLSRWCQVPVQRTCHLDRPQDPQTTCLPTEVRWCTNLGPPHAQGVTGTSGPSRWPKSSVTGASTGGVDGAGNDFLDMVGVLWG